MNIAKSKRKEKRDKLCKGRDHRRKEDRLEKGGTVNNRVEEIKLEGATEGQIYQQKERSPQKTGKAQDSRLSDTSEGRDETWDQKKKED